MQKLTDIMDKLDEIATDNEDLYEKLMVIDSKINTICGIVAVIVGSGVGFIVTSIIMDILYDSY